MRNEIETKFIETKQNLPKRGKFRFFTVNFVWIYFVSFRFRFAFYRYPFETTFILGWFVGSKTIIVDVRTFSNDPKVKYHGTYDTDGFGVVIRNLSEADLNVTYRCIYGFNQSTPKYLFHGDVFKESK